MMSDAYFTTPFGRRPMTLGQLARQNAARAAASEGRVQKWQVFRDITEGKARLGVSDRSLAVLNALLSFHPETLLAAGNELVVFPSNRELSLRAHGMAPATLRRHLAALVEAGLVIRRDSPNGKRYARKGPGGVIETAYGFDLSPLVSRAGEFERIADDVRAHRKAVRLLRERITLLRRDARKLIQFAEQETLPGPWPDLADRLASLSSQLPPTTTKAVLEATANALQHLCNDVHKTLEDNIISQKMSADESQSERHLQTLSSEDSESEDRSIAATVPETPPALHQPTGRHDDVRLEDVLSACPTITDYCSTPITSWSELLKAADLVRTFLGIGRNAWHESCQLLGPRTAAAVIAAVLERHDQIHSPRAYLHALTARARIRTFSVGPMLLALRRAKLAAEQPTSDAATVNEEAAGRAIGTLPPHRPGTLSFPRFHPPIPLGRSDCTDPEEMNRYPVRGHFARPGPGT
ncbi:replication initiation protein RepC [Chelatococcus caeni]|uniref:Replication initiation protein RepC n=2 Tax=Chelatococcaceae TaxID=2036754 RepID=A0A840BZM6_9HYPH|nr:plasmid replication protein RepC [Chelatococcus sp. CO-6]MBB4018785.1 replication initiation protein RepC [Chelatococcus caeni]